MIHAIVCSFVFMSGAGTSRSGPRMSMIAVVYLRVRRSSSLWDIERGSQTTPPLPPPNGTLTTAHFQVIHAARARTSSRSTCWSKRMPPFAGPRTKLCCTR
jgi:hypothetical protein